MKKIFDVFISYGRSDSKAFATKLQASLNKQEFRVWFDFNDIPPAVDFQNQIDDGIEKASHFLFIISPSSVNSPYCRKELELAIARNKRIIPLMHVEEINRETWQQRKPDGTDEQWEAYKAEGKHTVFKNMHQTISKINWMHFQEDKDDFEKSLAGLIDILRSHADYVEQQTRFLVKALEWERNQKQTNYLLIGEEKQQAESWLKIRFKDEQPPCIATDLHCEYITESIKNGNNLMTMVFLSYANEDKAMMEKLRLSLRRESITVWTNTTDIPTGEAFESAIKRGIEQADNVVYLLSPDSVNSTYCQFELDYALSLHKRIIPLLVRETDSTQVPSALQELHYIDFTDNVKEDDYLLDESQLLKILHEDAAYYNEHKILLTKALKWKEQHNNPSILLRGYNLQSAEAWLKVAQKRIQHPPTPLHSEFITESLQQPPLESLDVFISYSRADSDLARKLNDALQIQGKMTWFDQESIASGSDFQQEIYRGIKASDNFLFILSARSVSSPYCKDEVEYAAKLNKRFVTVLHRPVNPSDLHPELAKVQWIDFNQHEQDFNANFNQLVRTLETDREHVHSHSKWSQRALEWEQKDKSNDLLLRGSEFAIAQKWLQETEQQKKKPAPTLLQKDFIEASLNAIEAAEKEEKRRQTEMLRLQSEKTKEAEARLAEQKKSAKRQKFFLVGISMALVAAVGFSVVAFLERKEAKKAQKDAEQAQKEQLDSLSQSSLLLKQQNLKFDALLVATRAGSQLQQLGNQVNLETRSLILTALQAAVYQDGFIEQNRLTKHSGTVFDAAWSRDGKTIATASGDGTIKLWNQNGQPLSIEEGNYNNYDVYSVSFSPDGNTIVSGNDNGTVKLWSKEVEPLITINSAHKGKVWNVAWSPDGNTIASASEDKTVKLWSKQGELRQTLKGYQKGVMSVTFSPDGKTIATESSDGTIKFWNLNGQKYNTIKVCDNCTVHSVSFTPDGKTIASASSADNGVKLWDKQGKLLNPYWVERGLSSSVAWSSNGKTIAIVNNGNDNDKAFLWSKRGELLDTLTGHEGSIKSVKFSPDGKTIATTSEDNTVKLWRKSAKRLNKKKRAEGNTIELCNEKGKLLQTLQGHKSKINSLSFSPDGKTLASAKGNIIELCNEKGKLLQTLQGHKSKINSLSFSPDCKTRASAKGNIIELCNEKGKLLQTLQGHKSKINSLSFSPDGKTLASASNDNTVKLWRKEGNFYKEEETLKGHKNDVLSVTFSPDGKTIASGSKDYNVKLWNEKGEPRQTLIGHNEPVISLSFSPDSNTLTSSSDKTAILWDLADLKLEKLMEDACAQVRDYLESNDPDSYRTLCK